MLLLADENFPRPSVLLLRAEGHDVLWADSDLPEMSDVALLELAEEQGRIILTLDKDFLQIGFQRPTPLRNAGIVLFRVHPAVPVKLIPLLGNITNGVLDLAGQILVIYEDRVHVWPTRKQ